MPTVCVCFKSSTLEHGALAPVPVVLAQLHCKGAAMHSTRRSTATHEGGSWKRGREGVVAPHRSSFAGSWCITRQPSRTDACHLRQRAFLPVCGGGHAPCKISVSFQALPGSDHSWPPISPSAAQAGTNAPASPTVAGAWCTTSGRRGASLARSAETRGCKRDSLCRPGCPPLSPFVTAHASARSTLATPGWTRWCERARW